MSKFNISTFLPLGYSRRDVRAVSRRERDRVHRHGAAAAPQVSDQAVSVITIISNYRPIMSQQHSTLALIEVHQQRLD